jgi:hypothetical protein
LARGLLGMRRRQKSEQKASGRAGVGVVGVVCRVCECANVNLKGVAEHEV